MAHRDSKKMSGVERFYPQSVIHPKPAGQRRVRRESGLAVLRGPGISRVCSQSGSFETQLSTSSS
jgi:hypothetical protein